jgi:hypothetical protein
MVVVRASETCFPDFRWRIQQTNSSQQSIANQSLPTPNRRHSARYPPISSRHVASFSPQSSGTHHQTGDTPPIGDTPPNPAQLVICSEANETDDSDVESGHADTLIQVHPPGTHHPGPSPGDTPSGRCTPENFPGVHPRDKPLWARGHTTSHNSTAPPKRIYPTPGTCYHRGHTTPHSSTGCLQGI